MQEISAAHKDLAHQIDQQLWISKGKELDHGETELVNR